MMRKTTALIVAVTLLFSCFTVNGQEIYSGRENFNSIISAVTYNDVSYLPVDHWSTDAVYLMTALGIIKGSDGNFNNEDYLSKSEGLALAFRTAGLEGTAENYRKIAVKNKEANPGRFNNTDAWADGYLRLAVDKKIISVDEYNNEMAADTSFATFNKTSSAEKGDFVIWLVKAMDMPLADKLNFILDYTEAEGYTQEEKIYLETAMRNNILKGDGVSLGIRELLTREQAAQILFNVSDQCAERLGVKIIRGTVDNIDTNTKVENGVALVTKEIYVADSVFTSSKMYKMNGEAVDKNVSFDKEYCDILTLSSKSLPSDSSVLVQGDNVKCYVKDSKVICITKFEDRKTEIKHNEEDYNDSKAYSGILYFVDTDERNVVIIDDNGEYVEVPYLPDAYFCNRNTELSPEILNEKWTDCPVYIFTIVKKTGGLSRAYRVQVVSE